jgi:hypothetical protein
MKKVFLAIAIMGLVACNGTTTTTAKPIYVDSIIPKVEPINPKDGVAVEVKSWPIKVISVERNVDKSIDMKWEVVTENGVMYYTNNKPAIGQVAFCLGIDEEIINCECNK